MPAQFLFTLFFYFPILPGKQQTIFAPTWKIAIVEISSGTIK